MLQSQRQVDNFNNDYGDCKSVYQLEIDSGEDITNLDGLSGIEEITVLTSCSATHVWKRLRGCRSPEDSRIVAGVFMTTLLCSTQSFSSSDREEFYGGNGTLSDEF